MRPCSARSALCPAQSESPFRACSLPGTRACVVMRSLCCASSMNDRLRCADYEHVRPLRDL